MREDPRGGNIPAHFTKHQRSRGSQPHLEPAAVLPLQVGNRKKGKGLEHFLFVSYDRKMRSVGYCFFMEVLL